MRQKQKQTCAGVVDNHQEGRKGSKGQVLGQVVPPEITTVLGLDLNGQSRKYNHGTQP